MTSDATPAASDTSTAPDLFAPPSGSPGFDRSVRWVPHGDLVLEHKFWANPRSVTGLDDQSILELGASIKAGTTTDEHGAYAGVRIPFEVLKVKSNGTAIDLVMDGQRRHRAITAIGLPDDLLIPVIDLEPEPVDFTPDVASRYLVRALETVGHRAGLSSYELVENAVKLRQSRNPDTNKEYTLIEIGRAIGRSESWVSKMLTARTHAAPKLVLAWKTGEITDEAFKDAAAIRTSAKQSEVADKMIDARKSGDKGSARTLAKEQKLIERQQQPAKPTKAEPATDSASKGKADRRVVRGPQVELPVVTQTRKPPPFAVLEDVLSMTDKNPPTHEYVRGIVDGVRWATGLKDPATLAKPWHGYLDHVAIAKLGRVARKPKAKGGGKGKGKAAKPGKKRR